ncbi:glycosyltransferase [Hymenobacter sp. HD11105]
MSISSSAGRVVLLASVLKPLNDTRMLGKFARTLAALPESEVHVAGRRASAPKNTPHNLHTHELLAGSRLSGQRLLAQWRYWQLLHRLRPNLVIVHAPELLPLTMLWQKTTPGGQFIYDVRENYALNIRTQAVYPAWLRNGLAGLVRRVETWAGRQAAHIILAEHSYAEELPFAQLDHTVILENKYQPADAEATKFAPQPLPQPDQELRLLYSGTISALNGVFEALELARHIRAVWPRTHLTIIGFCQQPEQLRRLQEAVAAVGDYVTLTGGDTLVPHSAIVAEIKRSHIGLLPYRPHPSTWRCRPTKLFEYLAHGLPVLLPPNLLWTELADKYGAGLALDFQHLTPSSVAAVADALRGHAFYPNGIPAEAFWASEGQKLSQIVNSIR